MSDVAPVIVEIFKHLPVRSLLRFRSVSKSWKDLIDSPYFINLHLNQSKKKDKIFTLVKELNHSTSSYSLCLNSSQDADKLVIPLHSSYSLDRILGSCNGLLFLSKGPLHREILLWNPSTRRHRLIRRITMPIGYPDPRYGFPRYKFTHTVGYDHENDDYKVVELSHHHEPNSGLISSKVSVYSIKLNSRQLLGHDFPYQICEQRRWRGNLVSCSGSISHWVFIGGCINWVATKDPAPDMDYLIVSFDIARHNFDLVAQPKYSSKYKDIDLGKLDECLCVVGYHETSCVTVDVWVMGTYRVMESWKKLVTVTMCEALSVFPCVRPITYLKNGKEVMFEVGHKSFVRYDLKNKTKTFIPNNLNESHAIRCVYHESLVF